jgi:hypothetical protein
MNAMPRRRTVLTLGLIGLAALAFAGFAAAQVASGADRILLLQAKRFEGTYALPSGNTTIKVGDTTADWSVASGGTNLTAAIAPQTGQPDRATLSIDGRTVIGKAAIEGRTLTFDFVDGKTIYRIRLSLSGRNEGDLNIQKNASVLVAGALKRA